MIKKFLLFFTSLFLFLIIVNIQLNAISFLPIEDRILLDVNLNDNFKDDSIIISLSKQKSEVLIDLNLHI